MRPPQPPARPAKTPASKAPAAGNFEAQVRARIETLAYLPTTSAVAMKFIELGKDPEASPTEYIKVISSDVSLSTKLLALANSSWFGVRNRVTKIQVAVNLLGLSTVRTLAISYCLTGLHNELKLKAEESRIFWSAALCKAVAAKQLARRIDPKCAEEAFAAGLFQDFALPIMYSVARDKFLSLIQDPAIDWQTRLQKERELFKLDHAELARSVALKLELPEVFVDAVAFHHNLSGLKEFCATPALAQAAYGAALFPHVLEVWNSRDARELKEHLAAQATPIDSDEFMESVQKEFDTLYRYFEQGNPPETRLSDALAGACREAADSASRLVGTVQELLEVTSAQVRTLLEQQDSLQQAAEHDGLTGALNREGFMAQAREFVARAAKDGSAYAVAYVDLDRFKQINDKLGHEAGDAALRHAARSIRQNVRAEDLAARFGGDEFVALLKNCTDVDVAQCVAKIVQSIGGGAGESKVTASVGVVFVPAKSPGQNLESLLSAADGLMYQSKRAGGNRASASRIRATPVGKVA